MPTPIAASDIIDLQTTISANADVVQATLLRHNRAHSLMSTADHTDVTGTPSADNVLCYKTSDNKWHPTALHVVADGGTR